MSTVAYPALKSFAVAFAAIYRTAVCSGICGDTRHRQERQGTYHLSRQDNPPTSFSVIRPDDRAGNGPDDAASALDMSMGRADMVLCTRRLIAVFGSDRDPRRKYINAFNGWLGTGDAVRYDMVTRKVGFASPDHKWHIHLEIRRAYVLSAVAYKAILSALRGETLGQYLASIGVKPATAIVKAPVPRYPGHVLARTAHNPAGAVKQWQARMIARGWTSIGKADDHFGPKTESVVRRYQASCRVRVNGQIDPVTWPLPWTRPLG